MLRPSALGRSNRLASGSRWPIFGYLIVVAILAALASQVVFLFGSGILDALGAPATVEAVLIDAAATLVTAPFLVAAVVAQYIDLRVRRDRSSSLGTLADGQRMSRLPTPIPLVSETNNDPDAGVADTTGSSSKER